MNVTYEDLPLERLAFAFRDFGERQAVDLSPFYAYLTVRIADDPDLLRLASHARRGQPIQNMLLAAVHDLLLRGASHPLRAYYASTTDSPAEGDPFPAFHDFCLRYAEPIRERLQTRRVQTNEVARTALLLPAFGVVTQAAASESLALVEVGASAGLNLLWDHYGYRYSDGRYRGSPTAALQLECQVLGDIPLPLPEVLPRVVSRVGIDINPINIRDAEAVAWLRALVWPDQPGRMERLKAAITLAQADPPLVLAGDAFERLPDVLAGAPPDAALCVYHSYVLNQFTPEDRARFYDLLAAHSHQRDLYCVALEWIHTPASTLTLYTFHGGERSIALLATCDAHGRWIEWQRAPNQE